MFNLMRLEFKKFKLQRTVKGIIIANLILLASNIGMMWSSRLDEEAMFGSTSEAIMLMNILVMSTFIIYGSVILAKLTVSEYKNKTIQLMFMYPINRKKLFISKLAIVYLFTSITVAIGCVVTIGGVGIMDRFVDIIPGTIDAVSLSAELPMIGTSIIVSGILAIVPLFFGMRKKSTAHTIIAAVVIVALTSSSNGGSVAAAGYFMRIIVMGIIAVISVVLTMVYTLNNIDSVDID